MLLLPLERSHSWKNPAGDVALKTETRRFQCGNRFKEMIANVAKY
jgi:hypothetical protein